MGAVRCHVEEYRGNPQGVFTEGDGETGKEAIEWNLAEGRGQERVKGYGDTDHKDTQR